jgi:hypothetical protein
MTNYIIEGNIDFYSELYKSLDESSDLQSDNLCLITSEPLKENYITLDCNHKFNYVAIYNDIVTCKTKTSYLDTQHLSFNEIRCPYCRKKQSRLLPYYENMGLKKIHGVNYVDETLLYSSHYKIGKCSFQNENENENICCSNTYVSKLKEDGKDYCYQHKKLAKAQIVKNILLKNLEFHSLRLDRALRVAQCNKILSLMPILEFWMRSRQTSYILIR